MTFSMKVLKRNGSFEPISFDKVLGRIRKASRGLQVNPDSIAQQVLMRIYDGVKTSEIDELTGQLAASLSTTHPDYGVLASRVAVSNHQKNTDSSFTNVMLSLANQTDPHSDEPISYINYEIVAVVKEFGKEIDAYIDYDRDYLFDYFGFKTLEKSYLLRDSKRKILERPQHLWMRVSIAIWGTELKKAFETYDYMSQKYFTHATPTLFNAGTQRQQLSSCFVAGTKIHTMNGIKNIEDVSIDDEVVTHTGSIKKVKQLHTNLLGDRKLFTIKIAGTPSIKVTDNHRLWSISEEQEKWGKPPSWNSIEYLRTGDWVAIPNKKQNNDSIYIMDVKEYLNDIISDGNNINYVYEYTDTQVIPSYNYTTNHPSGIRYHTKKGTAFNRYWKFNNTMMEFLGMWYGDGSVTHGKNSNGVHVPKNINVVTTYNNNNLIDFLKDSLPLIFGIDNMIFSTDKYGMSSFIINNTIIAQLFVKIFKCKFDGKRIPSFFNKLSFENIKYFLAGLVSTDGCVSKEHGITIQLTNPTLVTEIFHLARSVGIPISLSIMNNKDNKKATGRLQIPKDLVCGIIKKHYNDDRLEELTTINKWNNVRIIDGKTFMRLNSKEICNEEHKYVYTFGVEDDHSYSVGGIIAENCFLLAMADDSVTGIYKTLSDCAMISKYSGGIGLHIHNIRARGSAIKGTNGISNGIVPMLRVFNNTARYIDQGGGKRNGSFAIYLEPWHADIEDFIRMKQNTGNEEERARDLFYALWIPDLFMKRIQNGEMWSLFCPNEAPGLADVVGDDFEALYTKYESEKRYRKQVNAQKLWFLVLDSQIETGTPYLLYKDAANLKSNQKNLGVIKSSNLCVAPETLIYTPNGEIPIEQLKDNYVEVWNGTQWSQVLIKQTGINQKLIRVTVKHDQIMLKVGDPTYRLLTLDCTPYHKFILNDNKNVNQATRIEAKDLKEGMQLFESNTLNGLHYTVVSIEDNNRYDDTYCFNEPINHAGVFNGILTSQCTEILEYSDKNETAVCNLASIGLPAFVKKDRFDFTLLRKIVGIVTHNLNRVIDINYYPTPETKTSNMRHRPIGLGVQGLADVFALLKISWESVEAKELNKKIFEHMYYAALEASMEDAKKDGPYSTFAGSPSSKGILQFDMWNVKPNSDLDWDKLKKNIVKHGLRNSLLVAPMPTASTSQILGYNECFEPFTTNIYTRRTLAGEFVVINKYLLKELIDLGIWNEDLKQNIVAHNGSIQNISDISESIKPRYKTSWELSQQILIDMAAERGPYICQSQSLNLFMADPNYAKLTSMHFYAWKKGLKTGCYYLRTKAPVMAQKFTVDPRMLIENDEEKKKRERRELAERYAMEYEEEQRKAKEAADKGEGCLFCSS